MKPPLRIAILECDTPLAETRGKYGGYCGVFKALLAAGADSLEQPDVISSEKGLEISCFDVVDRMEYPDLEEVDAVLITGSRHNSFDNTPWILRLVDFTQSLLRQNRTRTIGVCFGHQIIGRALGCRVGRSDRGWETSVCHVTTTSTGKRLFGGKEDLKLFQMHRDVVYAYPHLPDPEDGASETSERSAEVPAMQIEPLGSSPECDVQGMYCKGRFISVQGHPEFTEQIVKELLVSRHEQGVFDEELFEGGMRRVGERHDGVLVAGAFLRFLMED